MRIIHICESENLSQIVIASIIPTLVAAPGPLLNGLYSMFQEILDVELHSSRTRFLGW